jgi:hypothetical protein
MEAEFAMAEIGVVAAFVAALVANRRMADVPDRDLPAELMRLFLEVESEIVEQLSREHDEENFETTKSGIEARGGEMKPND